MSDWQENANGNYVLPMGEDGVFTVVKDKSGTWRGIHDGAITKQGFEDAEQAMSAAEYHLDGERRLEFIPLEHGWRKAKKGGFYRNAVGRNVAVKQAKSGAWFVVINGSIILGKWFANSEEARRLADAYFV